MIEKSIKIINLKQLIFTKITQGNIVLGHCYFGFD